MSDEPNVPDEGDEEQAEHAPNFESHEFYRVTDKPNTEEEWAKWRSVRDDFFYMPTVAGSNPPNFEVTASRCENGCHVFIWIEDKANDDEPYLLQNMPAFIAQMSGMVDFNGNVNPIMIRNEIMKRRAVLN